MVARRQEPAVLRPKTADGSPSGGFDWWWAPLDGREPTPSGAYGVGRGGSEGADRELEDTVGLPAIWTVSGVVFSAQFGDSINLWRLGVSERTGQAIETSLERLTNGAG